MLRLKHIFSLTLLLLLLLLVISDFVLASKTKKRSKRAGKRLKDSSSVKAEKPDRVQKQSKIQKEEEKEAAVESVALPEVPVVPAFQREEYLSEIVSLYPRADSRLEISGKFYTLTCFISELMCGTVLTYLVGAFAFPKLKSQLALAFMSVLLGTVVLAPTQLGRTLLEGFPHSYIARLLLKNL